MKFPEIHIHIHVHDDEDLDNQRQRVRQLQSLSHRLSRNTQKLNTVLQVHISQAVEYINYLEDSNMFNIDEVIVDFIV